MIICNEKLAKNTPQRSPYLVDEYLLKGYGATWKSGVHVIILSFFSEFLLIHQLKVKDYIMKLFHIAIRQTPPFVHFFRTFNLYRNCGT